MNMDKSQTGCDYKQGALPTCAPLAAAYIPMQQENGPKYHQADALARGTLFPGLDLPWMNLTNSTAGPLAGTPLGELMALDFVVKELSLYLDTHAGDQEALKLFTEYVKLLKEGRETYAARFGPIDQTQITLQGGYTWLQDPWPWDYVPAAKLAERRNG